MLRTRLRRSAPRPDRGSAIFLFPAGVLVVLVLGAIAVDLTIVHLASRQVADAASAAADDAVAAALDVDALRRGDDLRLDHGTARAVALGTIDARQLPFERRSVDVTLGPGPDQVTVVLVVEIEPLFGAALTGSVPRQVTGRGTATLVAR